MVFSVSFDNFTLLGLTGSPTKPPAAPKVPQPPAPDEPAIDSGTVKKPGNWNYKWVMYHGPLFGATKGPKPGEVSAKANEVFQQALNDCPLCADTEVIANACPEELAKVMGGDNGKYWVKFADGTKINVTGWMPTYANPDKPGEAPALLYGGGAPAHHQDPDSMRMFFPILQKAYAIYLCKKQGVKLSYDVINNGMDPAALYKALFGWQTFETPSDTAHYLKNIDADATWNRILYVTGKTSPEHKKSPATVTTFGHQPDYDKSEDNTIVGNHTYGIIDSDAVKGPKTGKMTRWVKMRNPWGSCVPPGKGPHGEVNNDKTGFFWIPLDPVDPADFPDAPKYSLRHCYEGFQVGFPPGRQHAEKDPLWENK